MGAVRDKLEKFLNRQIEKGNVNWPNQAALIRAAGFKNTTGETSRVMANFVDKFTFDDFTDTDLFRKFLNEKISELKPGEKLTFKGPSPKQVIREQFTEWMKDTYGRKPKITDNALRDIVLYSGASRAGSKKGYNPEIGKKTELIEAWDPREYYRKAVKEKRTFGGKGRDKYRVSADAEDEFIKFYEENKGTKNYKVRGGRRNYLSPLAQQGKNLSALLENFVIESQGKDKTAELIKSQKGFITEPELGTKMGYRSAHRINQIRNIATKVKGAPTTSEADSVRMWKWIKENLKPKKIIDNRYNVGDIRRIRFLYKDPDEALISRFNKEAKFRIDPEVVKRIKKMWLSKQPIKGGEFDGKTIRQVLESGNIHKQMWSDINKTLKTDYTTSQASRAIRYIIKGMQGSPRPETKFIGTDKNAADKLIKIMAKAKWGDPLAAEFRNLAFDSIDENLGREAGTHKRFVDRLKRILKKEGIPLWSTKSPYGFNVNEVASMTATFNNKAYPYSQFIDLAEGKLNTQKLPGFQGSGFSTYLSELRDNLNKYKETKNPNDLNKAKDVLDRFNKTRKSYQTGSLKDYRLPKIFLDVPEAGEGYYKSVQDIYTPAKVKEYKEKFGLDLEEFGKKELYNIDVGRDKIPLEKAISPEYRSTLLNNLKIIRKEFENNTNNVCDIFGARPLANGGVPNGCGNQFDEAVEKNPTKLLTDVAESNVGSNKIKGMAQRMLTIFPKLGTVGKIGTVAAGAGIALSGLRYNPEKGEIVTTDNDQKADQNQILQYVKDNPLKVTAGTSIGFAAQEVPGAYKAARDLGRGKVRSTLGISGAIRPILTTFGTPLMTGLYEGAIGSKRLDEGETMTEILTDPVGPALGLTLMEPLSKLSGVVRDAPKRTMLEGAKNYFNLSNVGKARPGITGQILRMGMSPKMIAGASRFLGLPGLALGLGMSGYDAYKNYQNQEGMIYNLFNRDE